MGRPGGRRRYIDPERRQTLGLAPMLPGLMLVIIIFWALAAVLMLTGTLINAREIKETVDVINTQVGPIDRDLDNVKLAGETGRLTDRIRERADPLSGQLTKVLASARRINTSVQSILDTAGAINTTAKTINGTVVSINGRVTTIGGTVVSIHGTVDSIGGKVSSIGSVVRSILSKTGTVNASGNEINAQVDRILGSVSGINGKVVSIDRGVAAINQRASRAITGARGIKGDFEGILRDVGFGIRSGGPDHGGNIHGHVNSIDCSFVVSLFGPTQYCGR